MSVRERFFKAMRRRESGYVPFDFTLCPSQQKRLEEKVETSDLNLISAALYN